MNPRADSVADQDLLARYSRQMLFAPLGREGQERLLRARVVLVGCGALGSVSADSLVRAGVGQLRIVDRDFLELNNLQRQVLFDEHDVAANLPKAEAAARKLRAVNSRVNVEAVIADLNADNAESLCERADLVLDGTDNLETRFLINDVAVKHDIPWVYGACVAAEGLMMAIVPGQTPCLRCLWDDAPPAGMMPTCDTVGVLGPLVHLVAGFQVLEALKLLSGRPEALHGRLITIDAWSGQTRSLNMQSARNAGDCPCCAQRSFEYLSGRKSGSVTTLCGRNAVQVLAPPGTRVDLAQLAGRLPLGLAAAHNAWLLRFHADGCTVTVFPDGRAIVQGTPDAAVARSLLARYIGT
jgi:molybdopterin/thiamine biosynthesis adenylyltransferase